jgi:hypothetical protein
MRFTQAERHFSFGVKKERGRVAGIAGRQRKSVVTTGGRKVNKRIQVVRSGKAANLG